MSKVKIYPVDADCKIPNVKIYVNDKNVAYTFSLNHTNIVTNNNKYYISQIVTDSKKFYSLTKCGSVGEVGKMVCIEHANVNDACAYFEKQFKSKTGNEWNAKSFIKRVGKYFKTNVQYEEHDEEINDVK